MFKYYFERVVLKRELAWFLHYKKLLSLALPSLEISTKHQEGREIGNKPIRPEKAMAMIPKERKRKNKLMTTIK
ncbi:hypothetical protein [Desulfitobacterium hafniense]|uniref:hypothetical protein n=1 Tax=Desulfitobacterium hafniense TaxID=49338 RepID=UPI000731A339|nr:hypothetical protein [Desulfitobacterium hafniense]MEA5024439.1 hypothetical protein [Desulfitobacterium hafniense]